MLYGNLTEAISHISQTIKKCIPIVSNLGNEMPCYRR